MSASADRVKIAIIGAGIASPVFGLTILANPTLRGLYEPIIYDKLPPPTDSSNASSDKRGRSSYAAGAAVALTSNALFPLYELGLRDSLHEVSCETTTINIWRVWNDKKSIESGTPCPHKWYNLVRNPNWTPEFETNLRVVERRDLQGILLAKFQELGGEVRWNKKLTAIHNQVSGSSKLDFEDGSIVDVDLVVGGDGNWSPIRKHIIQQSGLDNPGERWPPEFPGCGGIYGISDGFPEQGGIPVSPGDTHWILLDEGVASTWALPNGKIFWTISIPELHPPSRSSYTHEGGNSESENKHLFHDADLTCGGYSLESTLQLLKKHETVWHPVAGSFNEIFRHSDRVVRAPLWHKAWDVKEIGNSNAVVIGDASRAMLPSSGQGACFAIEDATTLANSLLNHPPLRISGGLDFSEAISRYAALRVPRSKKMASQSYWTGIVGLAGRFWWRWLRDFGTAWLPLGGDPKARTSPDAKNKDPMGWLHNLRLKVEVEQVLDDTNTSGV